MALNHNVVKKSCNLLFFKSELLAAKNLIIFSQDPGVKKKSQLAR